MLGPAEYTYTGGLTPRPPLDAPLTLCYNVIGIVKGKALNLQDNATVRWLTWSRDLAVAKSRNLT